MKTSSLILVIIGLICAGGQAFAINQPKNFGEAGGEVLGSVTYFKSTSNYNGNGNISDLPSGNYYQLIDSSAGGKYGITENLNLFAFFNVGSARSNGFDATRNNSSLNKTWGGAEFLFSTGVLEIIPEASFLYASEKISDTQDGVINSEGVNEFSARLNLQLPMQSFLLFGYAGYTFRDQERADLLPWAVDAEWMFRNFHIGGELFGFQPLGNDRDKGGIPEANRDARRFAVDGGSAKFYSINPAVTDSNIYVKWELAQTELWLAGGTSVIGKNYSNGPHVEVGLKFLFGARASRAYREERPRPRAVSVPVDDHSRMSTDKKIDKFKEDTNDGVDQRMFQPVPTPVPVRTPVAPPPPPRKPKTPVVTDQQIQDKMDDVEMQIELRSNKKGKGH